MTINTAQEYIVPNSPNVHEIIDEKLHSDEDTMCGSPHDSCPESRPNDSIFKCTGIFIDPALLFLDVFHDLRIFGEIVEETDAFKESHVSVVVTNEMSCENSSKISTIVVHNVAEDISALQRIDRIQRSVLRDKNKR